ncbi:MAG: type II toxin-antitoxin system VapC family toxin [Gammaproteobacteria bacterium]|nr:type II toxin-antitoxin system VapC family toxin [Gammaproteobacteria bacterium]MBU1443752.1 type II toxin-antitoxin system VapC family toxin [Gammaproteobacteria bacterium]MBU2286980.1 type II toxin-antitoxin system VapC family toxin [Gammaproteobacteria bacterium]MBU2409787.1 type II toxin-antitoxin system VapC family toxin [Gammaproteobacteria bacterium]
MYVLDTNVLSELRPDKPHASPIVRAWAASVSANQFFLTSITLMEHEIGIQRLERKSPPQGGALRTWFQAVLATFDGRVLPFDAAAALRCARMHVPDPRSFRDAMIAATALQHGFALVTRNIADFQSTGVSLVNPWDFVP